MWLGRLFARAAPPALPRRLLSTEMWDVTKGLAQGLLAGDRLSLARSITLGPR